MLSYGQTRLALSAISFSTILGVDVVIRTDDGYVYDMDKRIIWLVKMSIYIACR